MSRFHECLPVILKHEGGFVDHPADRGGRTNKGILQKVYDDYCRSLGKPLRDVRDIHDSEVEAIYMGYWRSCKADLMPPPLDLLVFDAAVNHGASRAIKLLQRALGDIVVDGQWGNQTYTALLEEENAGEHAVNELCDRYLIERRRFYNRIIANDPSQQVFAKGWMARVDSLDAEIT